MKGRERNEKFFDAAKTTNRSVAAGSMKGALKTARTSGVINLSNRSLSDFPRDACFYEEGLEADEKYWEICPLSKIDISYNKIESISPDIGRLSELSILKLRDNCLRSPLPKELFKCCPLLRHLDFRSNKLTFIEEEISSLFELRELFLGENVLEALPNSIRGCVNLQVLDLQNNKLRCLPKDFYFPNLVTLSISSNQLEELPRGLSDMTALQSIEVKKNNLQKLPSLSKLTRLTFIDASENRISAMPELPIPATGGKAVLDRLYMSYNKMSAWDISLLERQASSLTEIIFSNNLLDSIDPAVAVIRNLQVLDVSNNNINDLPATIGYLNSLQRLAVEGNPIRAIRRSLLTQSTNDLKTFLRTRGPPLTTASTSGQQVVIDDYSATAPGLVMLIPSHLITPVGNTLTDRIREVGSNGQLDLSSMGMTCWTAEFNMRLDQSHLADKNSPNNTSNGEFSATGSLFRSERRNANNNNNTSDSQFSSDTDNTNLPARRVFSVNLSKNAFKDIPDALISRLVCLNTLNLSGNLLSESVGFRPSGNGGSSRFPLTLTNLDISDNRLVNDQFSGIFHVSMRGSLQELNLSGNYLSELPNNFHQFFESLRVLKCSNCKLITIENLQFDKISNLETVDFSSNQLSSMQSLVNCNKQKLQSISVDNNNIKDIPPELGFFEKLRHIGLYGNPQKSIVTSKLSNTNAILLSLRNKSVQQPSGSNNSTSSFSSLASPNVNKNMSAASQPNNFNNNNSNSSSGSNSNNYNSNYNRSSAVGTPTFSDGGFHAGAVFGKPINASVHIDVSNTGGGGGTLTKTLSEFARKTRLSNDGGMLDDFDDTSTISSGSGLASFDGNRSNFHSHGPPGGGARPMSGSRQQGQNLAGRGGVGGGQYYDTGGVGGSSTSHFAIAKFKEGFISSTSTTNFNTNIVAGGGGYSHMQQQQQQQNPNVLTLSSATSMYNYNPTHHPGSSSSNNTNKSNSAVELKRLQLELQTLETELDSNISISNSRKIQLNRSINQTRANIARLKVGGSGM